MIGMRILICTDGSKAAERAAREVSLLRFPEETRIVLYYVMEVRGGHKVPEEIFSPIEAVLAPSFPIVERKVASGNAAAQILTETQDYSYDLVVIGDTGISRGLLHRRMGSTASKIMRLIDIPLLLVRRNPDQLKKVLVCTSGEAPAAETLQKGGFLVSYTHAQVGVLHVMSQLALAAISQADDLLDTAQTAMQRKTREGLHLIRAVEQIQQAGVSAPVIPILRHGLVLDQVTAELREGQYDLLVIGSHHVSGRSRKLEAFLEDVASDLISEAPCSVLIV